MKEQWKKQDSDAKLLQNVEEGRPQPIKIELSALGLKQDGCCSRLITFLRIAVLFVLLIILYWTAVNLYSNYYSRQSVIDENTEQLVSNQHDYSSEENKSSFRNKVYAMVNEQDAVSNEIDSFTTTSASTASFKLPEDNASDDEIMRILAFSEMLRMKNVEENTNKFKIEWQNVGLSDYSTENMIHDVLYKKFENMPEPESVNENGVSMIDQQTYVKLDDSSSEKRPDDYFKERFNLEDEAKPKPVASPIDQQVYAKLSDSPSKELNSDKEVSMEVFKNKYESLRENESNEVIRIPSLEDENTRPAYQNLVKYMKHVEAEDMEQLINALAGKWNSFEVPISEVDQINEESVAVIQEEIKNNEEKFEIVDLDKASSTEEKSWEESVAVVQEEIKNDEEDGPNVYLVDLEPISEEEDPNTEAVAVVQEEIKDDSGNSFKSEIIATPFGDMMQSNYKALLNSIEDNIIEKSQEKTDSEDTNLDDLVKNIDQDISSVEDKSREILSASETMNSLQLPFKLVNTEGFAVIFAKLLEPFVGEDYKLVHWYYNVVMDPSFVDNNDGKKVYAAKILYNQNITEYDTDMQMWLNEISEDSYISDFSDLINPQKQFIADTFLQKQIVDKLLAKLFLKAQYELNMITFNQVWEMIDLSNTNHIKSWFLATHPSVHEHELIPNIIASMDQRRKLYPMIKDDISAVRIELMNEDTELKLLNFDHDELNEEPVPSILEKRLILNRIIVINQLLKQEKVDRTAESISEETKITGDYLSGNENELTDDQYQLKQIQPATEREYDYSEESISKHQGIIEAMKKVGEEYEQTEKSAEETTSSFKNHDEIEELVEETAISAIKSDDDEDEGFKKEISPNFDQSESSNTNLNPNEELETVHNEQAFEVASEASEELEDDEEAFLKWLAQQAMNIKPEENEDDPFDY